MQSLVSIVEVDTLNKSVLALTPLFAYFERLSNLLVVVAVINKSLSLHKRRHLARFESLRVRIYHHR